VAFDRKAWEVRVIYKSDPRWWPCSKCREELVLVDGTLHEDGAKAGYNLYYPAEDFQGRFACLLSCKGCGLFVSVAGRSWRTVRETYDSQTGEDVFRDDLELTPHHVDPPPAFFPIPFNCPTEVVREVGRAFALFWCDTQAAANALRTAVEFLLDDRDVPRERETAEGRTTYLRLAERLAQFKQAEPELGEILEALKWLGNYGSHGSKVPIQKRDLFDGFECTSTVIDELYTHRPARGSVSKLAKKINDRRGPAWLQWKKGT